ncbi:MAG TPA: aspartate--tRNA ligase [Candidatus Coproplasma stercorigallinarum]|nr:aspartate--tRNA ligase [Candidatus Coproplasma stercorigallinarum]
MQSIYRTITADKLTESLIGAHVTMCGWVENIRDHGGVSFIDLRDFYGVVQVVMREKSLLDGIGREDCISVTGPIEARDEETYNPKIPTGTIELGCKSVRILGKVKRPLPFEVLTSKETREDIRLKYRFLDMRNRKVKENIVFRAKVISFLRSQMEQMGFLEVQTPILCASSPEGARDYIVPSRRYKGKFYALPQAPQQYKQLLMVGGIDRYFQIAPCFRDEDARADRSPGEFYQLDFEMAFATQEDVFSVGEKVLYETFKKFAPQAKITSLPFPVIPYAQAMLEFGTDKPDLRNPLRIIDLTEFFSRCTFKPFIGSTVRAIKVHAEMSKGFHEKLLEYALSIGMGGLGYLEVGEDLSFKGPIDKFIPQELKGELIKLASLKSGDTIFFIADSPSRAPRLAGQIRTELGKRLSLTEEGAFRFCFVNDFPMYEQDEETGKIVFTHNPFSMPQGGLQALEEKNPLEVLAYQYDIVCNGVELSSGAVRNHDLDIMVKAFGIAGYTEEELKTKFGALYTAFQFGAPPHAGMAPGIDRMLMLLCGEESIREVVAFPMSSSGQDLLCGAPCEVTEAQLRETHIKIRN